MSYDHGGSHVTTRPSKKPMLPQHRHRRPSHPNHPAVPVVVPELADSKIWPSMTAPEIHHFYGSCLVAYPVEMAVPGGVCGVLGVLLDHRPVLPSHRPDLLLPGPMKVFPVRMGLRVHGAIVLAVSRDAMQGSWVVSSGLRVLLVTLMYP